MLLVSLRWKTFKLLLLIKIKMAILIIHITNILLYKKHIQALLTEVNDS